MSANPDTTVGSVPLVNSTGFRRTARNHGITTTQAACEYDDNSLDSGASTVVTTVEENGAYLRLIVEDDGSGIPKVVETDDGEIVDGIALALSFGGRIDAPGTSIGRFGWGLSASSTCQSLETHVYSKTAGEDLYRHVVLDLDAIEETGDLELGPAETTHLPEHIEEQIPDKKSGTIVVLERMDDPDYRTASRMATELKKEISTRYRRFIDAGRTFIVNGEELKPRDPLYRMEGCFNPGDIPLAEPFLKEPLELPVPGTDDEIATVEVTLVNLDVRAIREKEEWSKDWMGKHDLNERNQGFSLVRNDREIARGLSLHLFTRNADLNYFRGEISFGDELDRYFGIQTNKSRFGLRVELRDKLDALLDGAIGRKRLQTRQIIEELKTERAAAAQEGEITPGERVAQEASNLLRSPGNTTAEEARERQEALEDERERELEAVAQDKDLSTDEKDEERRRIEARFQKRQLPYAIFFDGIYDGSFYDTELDGRQVRVTVNRGHPFFPVYEQATQHPRERALLDLLLISASHAELQFDPDADERMTRAIRQFRRRWSSSLEVALEELAAHGDEIIREMIGFED